MVGDGVEDTKTKAGKIEKEATRGDPPMTVLSLIARQQALAPLALLCAVAGALWLR